jgi:hypothetical protein
MFLASLFLDQGIEFSLGCALVGLLAAGVLIRMVLAASAGNEKMREIAGAVQAGARAYLNRQVRTIAAIAVVVMGLVFWAKGLPTAVGFVVGAVCSLAAGYIGMMVAVRANVRTTQAASVGAHPALKVAFNGGAVTGLLVVALGLLSVGIFYLVMKSLPGEKMVVGKAAVDSLIGLALGSSLISVFARLGGGIYTKAADVGADLVGKIEQNLHEDDPRNPATIADNVGDNVGDCAGMAADVFETYAVSLIGGVLVAFLTVGEAARDAALVYPFVLCGLAILASILGIVFVNGRWSGCFWIDLRGAFLVCDECDVSAGDYGGGSFGCDSEHGYFLGVDCGSRADVFGGVDHQLLHVDLIRSGASHCVGVGNRSCHEYHCWIVSRASCDVVAGVGDCGQYLDYVEFGGIVWDRHCGGGDAEFVWDHYFAGCLWTDYGQCGRHCRHVGVARECAQDYR